jgi:hypothetical protein
MASVDYTPVLLAQLTDLQMRVTKQESLIAALTSEVEKLSGRKVTVSDSPTMRTSIPLRPSAQEYKPRASRDVPRGSDTRGTARSGSDQQRTSDHQRTSDPRDKRSKPRVASDTPRPTMSLADVLHKDEQVTILVHTGKDEAGNFIDSTAFATFDGTDLNVTECEQVASLVGLKSAKPGEILYKFIEALHASGHIKRTFTIAPWKLCFVERNGVKQSLEELRTIVG